MLYVEEKNFDRQIALLNFVAGADDFSICVWLYPESTSISIAGFPIVEETGGCLPVTTYGDDVAGKHTELVPATESNIRCFGGAKSELAKNCDSLALYTNGNRQWIAATVGHEGMCLVSDDSLEQHLTESRFVVKNEPPEWW